MGRYHQVIKLVTRELEDHNGIGVNHVALVQAGNADVAHEYHGTVLTAPEHVVEE